MAKNNHNEISLDELFADQFISFEDTEEQNLEKYLGIAAMYAGMESCISVLSDLKLRRSHIFYGGLGADLGIAEEGSTKVLDTIWEDEILCRISEEDLVRKQTEEMRFFSYIKKDTDGGRNHFLRSSFHMAARDGSIRSIMHRIFYFHAGRTVRYALCLYNASSVLLPESVIVNSRTGEEFPICKIDSSPMLSEREKEVLSLIAKGLSSKEIADRLGISVYTVSRHRQNIIASMNVRNSSQACQLAHELGLI